MDWVASWVNTVFAMQFIKYYKEQFEIIERLR